jgi:hypothetical protein
MLLEGFEIPIPASKMPQMDDSDIWARQIVLEVVMA